ncbi:MAG: hypothetical protein C5B50_23420 [Verrucomicrobia bacterium]|nr:MAG: hypothetical protein C5B50_23420 [Verrucomicrobiota bacterium]
MDEVFGAAKKVVNNLGTLVNESTFYNQNTAVRTIEGKINQRNVYIRIESVDPKMCNCIVQARTRAGGVDVELAHYIDKEIALGLK